MGLELKNTLQGLGTTNIFSNLLSSKSLQTDISKISPSVVKTAENLLTSSKTTTPATTTGTNPVSKPSVTQPAMIQGASTSNPSSPAETKSGIGNTLIYAGLGTGALLAIKYGIKIGALVIGGIVLYSFVSSEMKRTTV